MFRAQWSDGFCSLVAIFYDLVHLTFANLWQSCQISTLLSISFRSSFFVAPTFKCSAFTGLLSSSILSTCPKHCNLCSLRNSQKIFLHASFHEPSPCLFYLSKFSHVSSATFLFLCSFHIIRIRQGILFKQNLSI